MADYKEEIIMTEILITTTEHIPGKEYEVIGEVFGLTTQSKMFLGILVLD